MHGLIVKEGSYENIKFCMEKGADPTIRNRVGNSQLATFLSSLELHPQDGKSCVDLVNNNTVVRAMLLGEGGGCGDSLSSVKKSEFMNVADWMPDADVTNCLCCQSLFGVFVRKHHCRLCGKIFCHKCSTQRYMGARVCDTCFSHKKALCS